MCTALTPEKKYRIDDFGCLSTHLDPNTLPMVPTPPKWFLKLESHIYSQPYIQGVYRIQQKQPHDILNKHFPKISIDYLLFQGLFSKRHKYKNTNKQTNKIQKVAS